MSKESLPISKPSVVAVVLAGGQGTRIAHLIPGLPKPMAVVAGKPFIYWVLNRLRNNGFDTIRLSLGYLAQTIVDFITNGIHPSEGISWYIEPSPLGTAGAFRETALSYTGLSPEYWLVLNGDSITTQALQPLVDVATHKKADVVISVAELPDCGRYGRIKLEKDGRVHSFEEKQPGQGTVNTGIYLIKNELLLSMPKNIPLSFEYDVFPSWIASEKNIYAHSCATEFLDIGTPESLNEADAFIRNNVETFREAS